MARKIVRLIVAVLGVIFIAIALGTVYYILFGQAIAIEENTAVEVVLTGSLHELPPDDPINQIFQPVDLSVWDFEKVFRYAAQDERISGIYLEIHPLTATWAQIEEMRDYIRGFRESKKPVHALLATELAREKELYLATAADSITMNPDAALLVNGLMAEVTFFKGTMEKLDIRPQFIQFKEYKSAENFTRDSMTPEIRQMYRSILSDIQERFVSTVSQDRGIEAGTLLEMIEAGISSADHALEHKVIDAVGYRTDIFDKFKTSQEPSSEDEKEYRGLSASRYFEAVKDRFKTRSTHRVALVGGLGTITSGHSRPYADIMGGSTVASNLRKIREDDDFEGVIFRVHSPGGSAVGSDMIWKQVRLLQESDKPVIISMSGVAGSGGYYISMGAHKIVSHRSTITGSIGVIFGKFDVTGFYEWLGVTIDQVKLSRNSDLLSPFHSLDSEQLNLVRSWIETIYQNFVRKAAQGRGASYEEFEPKARGRIYTGFQAKEIGLVDELGGLRTAVDQMKQALELKEDEEIELVLFPQPRTLWEMLLGGDLVHTPHKVSLLEELGEQIEFLSTPAPWLLMPEVRIH